MKQRRIQNKFLSGFSLIEVLAVISVVGLIAGISVVGIRNVSASARQTKLGSDLNILNSAVAAYLTFGGNLDGSESLDQVLTKLKTRASDATSEQVIGLAGYFLDPRYDPVMQTTDQGASNGTRVYWNASTNKFVSATSDPPGIREFQRNEDYVEPETEFNETRETILDYAVVSSWIWDYEDVPLPNRLGPILVVTGSTPDTTPPLPPTPPPPPPSIPLLPAIFSVPPGLFLITDFDLPVAIVNPNPAAVSELYYSIDFGVWNEYTGGTVAIAPGSVLKAQVTSIDPDYINSSVTEGTYAGSPGNLLPPVINLSGGAFNLPAVDTINVGLVNPNDSVVSRVDYRLNGGPWQTFSNGNFSMKATDYPIGVMIEAYTVSTNPYWLDSSIVSETIGAPVMPLPNLNLTTGIDPGSWAVVGATATYTFDDGTSIVLTEDGTSWSTGTVNSWNAWSKPVDGTASVEATFSKNDEFTVQVFDAANQPISPESIELHLDRLGGSSGSGIFNLQGGGAWGSTAGNDGFVVTSNTVMTSLGGTNQSRGIGCTQSKRFFSHGCQHWSGRQNRTSSHHLYQPLAAC